MDPALEAVMRECTETSDAGRATFPQVVAKLMAAGVERYLADLVRAEKIYYMPGGASLTVPCAALATMPAHDFSATGVEAAVRAIQAQKIAYREFCARIAQAGCAGYIVSLVGRRALYFGRDAQTYIEPFPAAR